jgi:protein-tyrosine phosphatase
MQRTLSERTKHNLKPERINNMNIMFLCTDNFTRSIIAEFCLNDYLQRENIESVKVSSSGIRASSDISKYSKLHFEFMNGKGIDTKGFKRTQFTGDCFSEQDIIIGMSEVHRDFIKLEFNKDIPLFNEIYNGTSTPVNIGSPDSEDFRVKMEELVDYFRDAMPELYKRLKERIGE